MDELFTATFVPCPACRRPTRLGVNFCTSCGHAVGEVVPPSPPPQAEETDRYLLQWTQIKRVCLLFLLLLANSLVAGILSRQFKSAWLHVTVDGLSAIIVAVFAVINYRDLLPLLRFPKIDRHAVLQMAAVAIGAFALISVYFRLFEWAGGPMIKATDSFIASGWPLWSMFLVISIAPAIVEEITFRGLIQSSLERVFNVRDAWLIQAALFGILHLLPVMFPSHFLMGLCFGFLRNRSKSLYPGMLLHAGWNAWVISSELHRW
jgi:membrane protease YdiL (CAAX protease family)